MLPPDVQEVARKVERLTQHHDKYVMTAPMVSKAWLTARRRAILNICMPYLSRDEIVEAVETTISDYQAGYIRAE